VKRLQIYIEPDMDAALAREAARTGVSKAAIIRRLIAIHTGGPASDPIDDLIGVFPEAPGTVDDVVYGR
jgi:Ribbon-helix-helix protein, copG family